MHIANDVEPSSADTRAFQQACIAVRRRGRKGGFNGRIVPAAQDMLAVPIRAECLVPKVIVEPNDFLDYEMCFLRHSKTREIKIVNKDNLRAKFEIVVQDDQSKRIGTYEADVWSGVIEPLQTQVV